MTEQHPITPPPELVLKWMENAGGYLPDEWYYESNIADQAARWGADQELEACCEWLADDHTPVLGQRLRSARRPKPPSLKEQALEALGPEPLPENSPAGDAYLNRGAIERHRILRRALEALPDD